MVKYTPNYNLGKPEGTDMYSVLPQNLNMDIIDAKLKSIETDSTNAVKNSTSALDISTEAKSMITEHLKQYAYARIYNNAIQVIPNDASTKVSFNTIAIASDSAMFNNNRINITKDGIYLINFSGFFDVNSNGIRAVALRKNGSLVSEERFAPFDAFSKGVHIAPILLDCKIGDYFEIFVLQNSGTSLNLLAVSHLQVVKVGY